MEFDPNKTGTKNSGLFALPFTEEESDLVLLPVPWEVTTSYGHGCSLGPDGIFAASKQLDVCDSLYGDFYQRGIFQRPTNMEWLNRSKLLKEKALDLRDKIENEAEFDHEDRKAQNEINEASIELNQWVYEESKKLLEQKKCPAVIGGDHSAPFGLIKALKEKYSNLSILHIDAHLDLRKSYQDYPFSHASIMRNVYEELSPESIVSFGIRDFCPEERDFVRAQENLYCYYDSQVSLRLSQGQAWTDIVDEALDVLSENVYISFDIDGLQPDLCPHTGTPVPGGLSFSQAEILLYQLSQSSKNIVGFDLCEVAPESQYDLEGWDTNVGARVLFKLAGALLYQDF